MGFSFSLLVLLGSTEHLIASVRTSSWTAGPCESRFAFGSRNVIQRNAGIEQMVLNAVQKNSESSVKTELVNVSVKLEKGATESRQKSYFIRYARGGACRFTGAMGSKESPIRRVLTVFRGTSTSCICRLHPRLLFLRCQKRVSSLGTFLLPSRLHVECNQAGASGSNGIDGRSFHSSAHSLERMISSE